MPTLTRLAFALLASGLATIADASVWIADDPGGPLGDYIVRFSELNRSEQRVVIDGKCYSACTAVIGLVPSHKICVTERAVFGFHAAFAPDPSGLLVVDYEATRLLYGMYPRPIQAWLDQNGGLRPDMIYLRGADLARLYPLCR